MINDILTKRHTIRNVALICIIALSLYATIYLSFQKQGVYKSAFQKQDAELSDLLDKTDLVLEKLDHVQKALDETGRLINEIEESSNFESIETNNIDNESISPETVESESGLVRLLDIDPTLVIDLKYATIDNFVGKQVYPENSIAVLRKGTALKLKKANEIFKKDGYTIKVWDAYRPLHVQQIFWDLVPDSNFVANPKQGSRHNRGASVDITLVDKDGNEIEMGTKFDDFSEKAAYNYPGHTETALKNMKYLRDVMEEAGFKGISSEWWHFDDMDWEEYEVLDIGFNELELK
jgi:D-alanyl-D-alanine dipeptidase